MSELSSESTEATQITLLTEQIAKMMRKHDSMLTARAAEAVAAANPESDTVRNLCAMIDALAKKMDTNTTPAPSTNGNQSMFVGLLSTANGVFPSLRSLFPDIKAAHITSIITHNFWATNLYKLDACYCDKEVSFAFNAATSQFKPSNCTSRDYKTFGVLYQPLLVYFGILAAHSASPHRTIPLVFFQFLAHLQKISKYYEWATILEYIIMFFNRHRMEMLENGDYTKWVLPDASLMAEY